MKNSIETINEFIIKKRIKENFRKGLESLKNKRKQQIREKYYYTNDDFEYLYEERLEQETPDGVAVFRQKDDAWVIYGDNGKQKIVGRGKDWKATNIKPTKMQWIGANPITTGAKMLLNKAAEKSTQQNIKFSNLKTNNEINKKIKNLSNRLTDKQKENLKNNNLYKPHKLKGYEHLFSGGLSGGSNDIRVLYDKEGNILDIGIHKEVYNPTNLKRINKNITDKNEQEKRKIKTLKK